VNTEQGVRITIRCYPTRDERLAPAMSLRRTVNALLKSVHTDLCNSNCRNVSCSPGAEGLCARTNYKTGDTCFTSIAPAPPAPPSVKLDPDADAEANGVALDAIISEGIKIFDADGNELFSREEADEAQNLHALENGKFEEEIEYIRVLVGDGASKDKTSVTIAKQELLKLKPHVAIALLEILAQKVRDTDGDGLSDAVEEAIGTDPTLVDSNADGILDNKQDSDGDGTSDALETAIGYQWFFRDDQKKANDNNLKNEYQELIDHIESVGNADAAASDSALLVKVSTDFKSYPGLSQSTIDPATKKTVAETIIADPLGDYDGDGLINSIDEDADNNGVLDCEGGSNICDIGEIKLSANVADYPGLSQGLDPNTGETIAATIIANPGGDYDKDGKMNGVDEDADGNGDPDCDVGFGGCGVSASVVQAWRVALAALRTTSNATGGGARDLAESTGIGVENNELQIDDRKVSPAAKVTTSAVAGIHTAVAKSSKTNTQGSNAHVSSKSHPRPKHSPKKHEHVKKSHTTKFHGSNAKAVHAKRAAWKQSTKTNVAMALVSLGAFAMTVVLTVALRSRWQTGASPTPPANDGAGRLQPKEHTFLLN